MRNERSPATDLMTELAVQDPNITRLMQIEEMFRTDPMLLRDYLIQERAHQDHLANLDHIRAEGREVALFATARRMKAGGMSDLQIAQFTGLLLADIEAL